MQTKSTQLHSFGFSEARTYVYAMLFITGNIILPQLCHLVPQGGFIFLPIYFFTLIASYKFGIKVGILTAVLSPVANHLLFGMPAMAVLPAILLKSIFLAGTAALVAHKMQKVTIWTLVAVVLGYQILGTAVEWIIVKDFALAVQDFRLGIPGMALQIFGGYFLIKRF